MEFVPPKIPGKVLVYGGGGFGHWVFRELESLGVEVLGVIDRSPDSCAWASAVSVTEAGEAFSGCAVVAGVFSPRPDLLEIERQLRESGLGELITPPQFFLMLRERGIKAVDYWLTTDITIYDEQRQAILAARELLADEESIRVYAALLSYRFGGPAASYPQPRPLAEQHTGIDFTFLPTEVGTVVDCGAFIGDTLPNWMAAKLRASLIIALEPDAANFRSLVCGIRDLDLPVLPLPLGVAEISGAHSVVGAGASSRLVQDPDGQVSAMSLDDLLVHTHATLIKMDIEGGEAAALRGGLHVLRRYRPHLALSVYHKPWHLWSIANWIDEMVGDYEMRLRAYGHQGYDTVLYARPK